MGLIVGSQVTKGEDFHRHLCNELLDEDESLSLLELVQFVYADDNDKSNAQQRITNAIGQFPESINIQHLASIQWDAVLSLTLDSDLEVALEVEANRHPLNKPVAEIVDFDTNLPLVCLPVFKLIGSLRASKIVTTPAEYRRQRIKWRKAIRDFSDLVKDNPVLCIGLDNDQDTFLEVLAELLGNRTTSPRSLFFFANDAIVTNEELEQQIQTTTKVYYIDGSIVDLVRSTQDAEPANLNARAQQFPELTAFQYLITVVNHFLQDEPDHSERNRLMNLLFAPTVPNWEPFVACLDFTRSLLGRILPDIKTALSINPFQQGVTVITGAAASGKTVLLKRIALELAKEGYLALWLRPVYYPDAQRVLTDALKALAIEPTLKGKRIVLFMDDPSRFSNLTPAEVRASARIAGISVHLVVAVRTSEWDTVSHSDLLGGFPTLIHEQLSSDLDEVEITRLPEYLVQLNIAQNTFTAEVMLRGVQAEYRKDVLSTLYWLIPETRANISESIRDEYFRLGNTSSISRIILGSYEASTKLLRDAYEMVAVSSYWKVPLPIEVLVSALGVPYSEWLDALGSSISAWGLLYADPNSDGDALAYCTRSPIVDRAIVTAVNGGSVSYAGEVDILRQLISACIGSQVAYRHFCVEILIHRADKQKLDYGEGLQLYDAALRALPYPDKALMHHKGIWVKDKGEDPIGATKILEEALRTPNYPHSRPERNEHIRTTLAATALDAMERGLLPPAESKAAALENLTQARSPSFFNPRAVHVNANLVLKLTRKMTREEQADEFKLATEALSDVNRTLTVLKSSARKTEDVTEQVLMLESVKTDILISHSSIDLLKADADDVWRNHRSQDGFVLVARKLMSISHGSGKGSVYREAFDYCLKRVEDIENSGARVSAGLAEVMAEIYYHWRIVRAISTKTQDNIIDWSLLLSLARQAPDRPGQPMNYPCRYIEALSLAHLERWQDAHAIFSKFRQSSPIPREHLWELRDLLRDSAGSPRRILGQIRSGGSRRFLKPTELMGIDFVLSRDERWGNDGDTVHVYIGFSYAGMTAITNYR